MTGPDEQSGRRWWAQGAKPRRHHTCNMGLDEQSEMRWWANGDITCSGMHHKSWGKRHRMSVFEVWQTRSSSRLQGVCCLNCPDYLSRCRQSPADILRFPCLHTPRRLRRSPHRESSAPPYLSHVLLKMVPHPAFARTFCTHTMESTDAAVCAPARLPGLHATLSPVPH